MCSTTIGKDNTIIADSVNHIKGYQLLQRNADEIKGILKENALIESKIELLMKEVNSLDEKLVRSKTERDTIIGQNFMKTNHNMTESLIKDKEQKEDVLVKIKLEHGKLSEDALEAEDSMQYFINSCRQADMKINMLTKEIEKIKIIAPPEQHAPIIRNSLPLALQNPIQLNKTRTLHARKCGSSGK